MGGAPAPSDPSDTTADATASDVTTQQRDIKPRSVAKPTWFYPRSKAGARV